MRRFGAVVATSATRATALALWLAGGALALVTIACSSGGAATTITSHDAGDATHPVVDAHMAKDSGKDSSVAPVDAGCSLSPTCNACLATDPNNCGTCGISCGTGGTCANGMCTQVLASGQGTAPNAVSDLIIDTNNIYWMPAAGSAGNGSIFSIPKTGGTITTVVSGISAPEGLTQDDTSLYFISHYVGIKQVAKTGGATTQLLQDGVLDGGLYPEFWLLRSSPDLYYVGGLASNIFDLVLDGGTGVPTSVMSATGLLGAPGTGYNAFAVDDGGLYYDTTSQIVSVSRATNAPIAMVPGSSATAGDRFGPTIAIDDTSIYYISNVEQDGALVSTVMSAPKTGGTATTITSDSVTFDDGPIVVDGTSVYWSHLIDPATRTSAVVGVAKSGGSVVTISSGCSVNCPFAVDATSVYWPASDGTIRSGPKYL